MSPEIPTQFEFEKLLSHTFPGFFSAITLFMLLDIWSPINLTSWASKDITSLLSLIGFVLLFGTILGILIDAINHSILQTIFKKQSIGLKEILASLNALFPYPNDDLKFGTTYFFKTIGENALDIHYYPIKSVYFYSEFYANTFISVVPFSFTIPFYLFEVLHISWTLSIIFALVSLVIASGCLYRSFEAFKDYYETRFSIICGFLNYGSYIQIKPYLFSWDEIPDSVNDSRRIIDFLEQNYNIDWVKTAKIEKIDDGKTIKISTEKNYLSLELNNQKKEVSLKIDDGRTDKFIVKMENGKLNIYVYVKPNLFFAGNGGSKLKAPIEATISYKASKTPLRKENIEVIFKTTFGDIKPQSDGKTDSAGVAKAILSSDKCGTAIVTAASKNCIPGVTKIQFRRL